MGSVDKRYIDVHIQFFFFVHYVRKRIFFNGKFQIPPGIKLTNFQAVWQINIFILKIPAIFFSFHTISLEYFCQAFSISSYNEYSVSKICIYFLRIFHILNVFIQNGVDKIRKIFLFYPICLQCWRQKQTLKRYLSQSVVYHLLILFYHICLMRICNLQTMCIYILAARIFHSIFNFVLKILFESNSDKLWWV